MAFWVNPDRAEMFFAKKAIFVEGETEKASLPYLAKKLGYVNQDISYIDCGSKNNLSLYILISNAFKIPYIVIHDEDPLPDPIPENWDEDKVIGKKRTFALNDTLKSMINLDIGNIEMLSPDFEEVAGISRNQGKKLGKALAALDHFDSTSDDHIPERIKKLIELIYEENHS